LSDYEYFGGDMLVVGDEDRRDVPGHFRSERGLARRNEGIASVDWKWRL
jgi:hypothetical protein